MLFRTALVIHVLGVVLGFGPTFAFPILGTMAQKDLGAMPALVRAMHKIAAYMATPADFIIPASGVVMILASDGLWDPFQRNNRWLLAGIILYIVLFSIGQFILMPSSRRGLAYLDRQEFGPEFMSAMSVQKRFGPIAGLLTIVIIILMITKPGCNCPHP